MTLVDVVRPPVQYEAHLALDRFFLQPNCQLGPSGDGTQELYTVWRQKNGCASRLFALENGELRLICETPDDPVAVNLLRGK